jgi:DNA-binding CsgD family transcriptional regulator
MSSDPLLVLHAQALAMPIAAFQAWALMHLKSQLPFDRALWGMGAGVSAGKAFINSIHLHRLPPTMMADYTDELRRIDPLAKATSAAVGVAANFCLADGEGLIHDGSERLVALLKSEWPHWTGPNLPKALHARDGTHWSGERVMVDFMAVHDCWLMKVRSRRAEDSLSEREHTIARRYADGASYKEIAQSLGTAPTTVRAHLRSIYSKLGVTRKTQLTGLLG